MSDGPRALTLTADIIYSMSHQLSMASRRCPIIWRQDWSDDPELEFYQIARRWRPAKRP
jgi:hypothetical protein